MSARYYDPVITCSKGFGMLWPLIMQQYSYVMSFTNGIRTVTREYYAFLRTGQLSL